MLFRSLVPILVLGFVIAPAAQAQGLRTEPPRELDGAWELVAMNGQPLPLAPVREGWGSLRVRDARRICRPAHR